MRTIVIVALASGCSLAMNNTPGSWRPAYRDPPCSESYVRPGFDGAMAVSAVSGALLTAFGPLESDQGCGGMVDQYTNQRPCSTYAGYIGVLTALAIVFATSAVIGTTRASDCARRQDERDAYLAQQGIKRVKPRYKGEGSVGVGLGLLVGGAALGVGALSFPKPVDAY